MRSYPFVDAALTRLWLSLSESSRETDASDRIARWYVLVRRRDHEKGIFGSEVGRAANAKIQPIVDEMNKLAHGGGRYAS